MSIQTFKRYEIKYMLNQEQYENVVAVIKQYMDEDAHCVDGDFYSIHNIYFDTEDDLLIQKSINKPYYKEKLRLRTYGKDRRKKDKLFLELKKKIGGIVAKRRVGLTYEEVMAFIEEGKIPIRESYQDQQVISEIKSFLERYKVHPKVFIGYERLAFFAKQDDTFRVSFDRKIEGRRSELTFDSDAPNDLILEEKMFIMEVKCSGAIPLWLTQTLSDMKIYKKSYSKYGTEYKQMIQKEKEKTVEHQISA